MGNTGDEYACGLTDFWLEGCIFDTKYNIIYYQIKQLSSALVMIRQFYEMSIARSIRRLPLFLMWYIFGKKWMKAFVNYIYVTNIYCQMVQLILIFALSVLNSVCDYYFKISINLFRLLFNVILRIDLYWVRYVGMFSTLRTYGSSTPWCGRSIAPTNGE